MHQSDRDILEHIVYDFNDHEMMEALRPSIEEAQPINSQQLALDYIGKRASQVRGVVIRHARGSVFGCILHLPSSQPAMG
jgi:DNA-directed RNA polymerase II subunit RPB2